MYPISGGTMKKFIILALTVFLFYGCTLDNKHKNITLVTNSWIGYSPLFYANEKGDLKKLGIKLIVSGSLGEASDIYSVGKADMVSGTQHEYFWLKETTKDIYPFMLLDKSYGGDMILSNKNIRELKNSKKIYAYLEVNSVNNEILHYFLKKFSIKMNKITFINKNQIKIQELRANPQKPVIIATYNPYDIVLKKHGFKVLASTRDSSGLVVVDGLFAKIKILKSDKKIVLELKKVLDSSIDAIRKNPKKSYKLISGYLENISYKDFLNSLKKIKWINKPPKKLLSKLKKMGYSERYIIR